MTLWHALKRWFGLRPTQQQAVMCKRCHRLLGYIEGGIFLPVDTKVECYITWYPLVMVRCLLCSKQYEILLPKYADALREEEEDG